MVASIIRVYVYVMTTYRHQLWRCGRNGVTIASNEKGSGFDMMPKPGSVREREVRLVVPDKCFDVLAKLCAVANRSVLNCSPDDAFAEHATVLSVRKL